MSRFDDPLKVKESRALNEIAGRTMDEDIAFVMSTPQGRRTVFRWIAMGGYFESSLHPSGSMVYAKEGERNLALRILKQIEQADFEASLQMMRENKKDPKEDALDE